MGLVTKIVSSAAIPVALVLGAAGTSMVALNDARDASRHVLARLAPVVREVGTANESIAALGRLHARWVLTGDPAYRTAWASREAALEQRLLELGSLLETASERRRLLKAQRAVTRYRAALVASDDEGERFRAHRVAAARRAGAASVRARRTIGAIAVEVKETAQQAESQAGATALQARNAMVAGALLAGALALLLSWWVGRRVARGLARLTAASGALERGRLDQPVAIGGRDELGRMAIAFESLAARLGERDRVCEDTIRRVGHDLAGPLRMICDATRALASDLTKLPMRDQTLVLLIGEAAEDLLRHADRIADDPTRPHAPPALEAPGVPALPAPRPLPALPALIASEKHS